MRLLLALIVASAAPAFAEPSDDTSTPGNESCWKGAPRVVCVFNVSAVVTSPLGSDAMREGASGRIAGGTYTGSGSVRPSITVGALFAGGKIDPGMVTSSSWTTWSQVGPEVQLGLELFPQPDASGLRSHQNRLYLSASPLYSKQGSNNAFAVRGAIGGNWMGSLLRVVRGDPGIIDLLFLLPTNLEFVLDRERGHTFTGFALGWGI
ncbi:MAG TPA: hypothetical protein VGM90_37180 [Kofleriaceae bacterium]|jgi:hypothetical protein